MKGTILTPTAIWKNFIIERKVNTKVVDKSRVGSVRKFELEIEGREVNDGKVNIYAEFYQNETAKKSPVIILLEDFSINTDLTLITSLVEQGYGVMTVDLAGKSENKEKYTKYPVSLDYANYEVAKDGLFNVSFDATKTCWYEWTAIIRYVVNYLSNLPNVTKIGGIAGNIGVIPAVNEALSAVMEKNTLLTSILASQVISNVPAAVLLSGFTENWQALLAGTNIGGLGTPIASMASLISLKLYMKSEGAKSGFYMMFFTVSNVAGLILLIGFYMIFG